MRLSSETWRVGSSMDLEQKHNLDVLFVCLVGWFLETEFLCVTLAVLELTL